MVSSSLTAKFKICFLFYFLGHVKRFRPHLLKNLTFLFQSIIDIFSGLFNHIFLFDDNFFIERRWRRIDGKCFFELSFSYKIIKHIFISYFDLFAKWFLILVILYVYSFLTSKCLYTNHQILFVSFLDEREITT